MSGFETASTASIIGVAYEEESVDGGDDKSIRSETESGKSFKNDEEKNEKISNDQENQSKFKKHYKYLGENVESKQKVKEKVIENFRATNERTSAHGIPNLYRAESKVMFF